MSSVVLIYKLGIVHPYSQSDRGFKLSFNLGNNNQLVRKPCEDIMHKCGPEDFLQILNLSRLLPDHLLIGGVDLGVLRLPGIEVVHSR